MGMYYFLTRNSDVIGFPIKTQKMEILMLLGYYYVIDQSLFLNFFGKSQQVCTVTYKLHFIYKSTYLGRGGAYFMRNSK